jgi:hypothetical protein
MRGFSGSNRVRPRLPRNRARHARRVANLRLQGIAAALAELARAHGEPDLALMVLDSMNLSVAELKAAGADAYDLHALDLDIVSRGPSNGCSR